MQNNLAIIRRALEEHHTIKRHVKLAGEAMSDFEALPALQNIDAKWAQSSIRELSDRQKQLQQTLSALEEGLRNHFGFEERALPPLLGEVLTQALLHEHKKIHTAISSARAMVSSTELTGLSQPELLAQKSRIDNAILDICQMVEQHANEEETVLRMMERGLQEQEQNSTTPEV